MSHVGTSGNGCDLGEGGRVETLLGKLGRASLLFRPASDPDPVVAYTINIERQVNQQCY